MDFALFLAKKTISTFLSPLGLSLMLWLAGLVLWLRKPGSRPAIVLVAIGGLWVLAMSLPTTAHHVLRPLEVSAGGYAEPAELSRKGVKFIVVLGGDGRVGKLTPADRVAYSSLVRLMEGIRLWKGVPGAKLVLSGGRLSSKAVPVGEAMAVLAKELGVPPDALVLETQSWDTDDEARLLKPVLGETAFALVTSACHVPRSMLIFKARGMRPLPAPADFETTDSPPAGWLAWLPREDSLARSAKGVHEYLGIAAVRVKEFLRARNPLRTATVRRGTGVWATADRSSFTLLPLDPQQRGRTT